MRRHWPIAFLGFLALALLIRIPAPPRSPERAERRSPPTVLPGPEKPILGAGPRASAEPPPPDSAPAALTPEPEVQAGAQSPVLAGLLWALRQQNEDGSWGDLPTTLGDRTIGKTGVTSLVLLALLGAGYSHLSKDEYDGISVGPRIKKGLDWLLSQEREDGSFQSGFDDRLDPVLAALAISETYGATASQRIQEPATRAMQALRDLPGADGGWGGPTTASWAIEALVSADLNELPTSKTARETSLETLRSQSAAVQLDARMMCRDRRDPELLEALAEDVAKSPPRPGETDFQTIYRQTQGLFHYDGPDGVLWREWAPAAREALLSTQNPDGSWNGGSQSHRLVRTSLAEFSLQVYWRTPTLVAVGDRPK